VRARVKVRLRAGAEVGVEVVGAVHGSVLTGRTCERREMVRALPTTRGSTTVDSLGVRVRMMVRASASKT